LEIFIQERILFVRERSNGVYSAWAYYFSKIMFDVVPLRVVPPVIMASIMYWMVGLRPEVEAFLWFVGVLVLFNVVCGGICFIIAGFVKNVSTANFYALVIFLFSVLFGGFLVNTTSQKIRYFRYASVFQYAVESLMSNELVGRLVWFNPDPRGGVWARGEVVLEMFAMNGDHFAQNFGILIGLSAVSIVLAGMVLRFCSKETR
jgi:ABC-type multidrug transport system permease subunit